MLMFIKGGGVQVPEKGRNKEGKLKAAEVVISRRAHKVETKAPVFIETARRTAVVKGKVKVVHSPRSITVIGWRWTQPPVLADARISAALWGPITGLNFAGRGRGIKHTQRLSLSFLSLRFRTLGSGTTCRAGRSEAKPHILFKV